jgi:hypothetical protein
MWNHHFMRPSSDQTWSIELELGAELRRLRHQAGKTKRDVSEARLGSREKTYRMESGKGPYKWNDVEALCRLYGASAEHTALLVEMAHATVDRDSTWLESSPRRFGLYLMLEKRATELTAVNGMIPGLLQTTDYHQALLNSSWPLASREAEVSQIKLRQDRQEALWARDGVLVTWLIAEAGLHHRVGTEQVMKEQLERLRTLAGRSGVRILYVPLEAPPGPAMQAPFMVVQTPLGVSIYIETIEGGRILSDPDTVQRYQAATSMAIATARDIREWRSERREH